VVAGCGGGSSSSAPATAGSTDAQSAETSQSAGGGADGGSNEKAGGETEEGGKAAQPNGGGSEKKSPPIEVPEGPPEKGSTKEQEERVPLTAIAITIPNGLTTDNTCKGKNVSPEMSWKGVPAGTEELEVFAVNVQPVNGKLFFDWAMAGIDPSVTSLKEGEVPDGAILGRNGDGKSGWSLCPKKSGSENYIFSVYAVGKKLSPPEGFDPLAQRVKAGEASEEVGLESVEFSG
jgi:phosphatidylethanolamine-binding protein (PEBP) family uncharacterized protein